MGPNIVFLLDNGAEMEQITWHPGYNNNTNYSPLVSPACDAVTTAVSEVPPSSNITLVLTGVTDSTCPTNCLFAIGTDIKGVTSKATGNVVSKTSVVSELHLEIDSIKLGPFQIGEICRKKGH